MFRLQEQLTTILVADAKATAFGFMFETKINELINSMQPEPMNSFLACCFWPDELQYLTKVVFALQSHRHSLQFDNWMTIFFFYEETPPKDRNVSMIKMLTVIFVFDLTNEMQLINGIWHFFLFFFAVPRN